MSALAVIAVGAGALIQAVTGFGFSLVSAPFLLAASGGRPGTVSEDDLLAGLAT